MIAKILNKNTYWEYIIDKYIVNLIKHYWTSNNGDFKVYYRNGVSINGRSSFPTSNKYLQKKEYIIILNFFIDFFTFSCEKPGSISLISPYKIFNETTHQISQNSFLNFTVSNKLEIIHLIIPMMPPNNYLN